MDNKARARQICRFYDIANRPVRSLSVLSREKESQESVSENQQADWEPVPTTSGFHVLKSNSSCWEIGRHDMPVGKSFVWFLLLAVLLSDKGTQITNAASLSAFPEGPDGKPSVENVTQISGDKSNGHFEAASLEVVSDQQERSVGSTREVASDSVGLSSGSQSTGNHENISKLLSVSPLKSAAAEDVAMNSTTEFDFETATSDGFTIIGEDASSDGEEESLWEGEDVLEESTTSPQTEKTSVNDLLNKVTQILAGNSTPSHDNETMAINDLNYINEDIDHLSTISVDTESSGKSTTPSTHAAEQQIDINKEIDKEASVFIVPFSNTSEPSTSSVSSTKESISIATDNQTFVPFHSENNAEFLKTPRRVNMNDKEVIIKPVLLIFNPDNSTSVRVDPDSDFSAIANEINTNRHHQNGTDVSGDHFSKNNMQELTIETTTDKKHYGTTAAKSDGSGQIETDENSKLIKDNVDQTSTTTEYVTTSMDENIAQTTETPQSHGVTQEKPSSAEEKQYEETTFKTQPNIELYSTSTMKNIEFTKNLSKSDNDDEKIVTVLFTSEMPTTEMKFELNYNVTTVKSTIFTDVYSSHKGNEQSTSSGVSSDETGNDYLNSVILEIPNKEIKSLSPNKEPLVTDSALKDTEKYYTSTIPVEETTEYDEDDTENSVIPYGSDGVANSTETYIMTNDTEETDYQNPFTNTEKYVTSTILVEETSEYDKKSLNTLKSGDVSDSTLDNLNETVYFATTIKNYDSSITSIEEIIGNDKNLSVFTSNNGNIHETVGSGTSYDSSETSGEETAKDDKNLSEFASSNEDITDSKLDKINETVNIATSTESHDSSTTSEEERAETNKNLSTFASRNEDITNNIDKINETVDLATSTKSYDSSTKSEEETAKDYGNISAFISNGEDITNVNVNKTDEYTTSTGKYVSTEEISKKDSSEVRLSEGNTTVFKSEDNDVTTSLNGLYDEANIIRSQEENNDNETAEFTISTENYITTTVLMKEPSADDKNLLTFTSNPNEKPIENSTTLLISQDIVNTKLSSLNETDEHVLNTEKYDATTISIHSDIIGNNLDKSFLKPEENDATYFGSGTVRTNAKEENGTDETDESVINNTKNNTLVKAKYVEESTSSIMTESITTENYLKLGENEETTKFNTFNQDTVLTNNEENNTNATDELTTYTEKYYTNETTAYYGSTEGTVISNNKVDNSEISMEDTHKDEEESLTSIESDITNRNDSVLNDTNEINKNTEESNTSLITTGTFENDKNVSESNVDDEISTNEEIGDSERTPVKKLPEEEESLLVDENEDTFKNESKSNDTIENDSEANNNETLSKFSQHNDNKEISTKTKETDTYEATETSEEIVHINENTLAKKISDEEENKVDENEESESYDTDEKNTEKNDSEKNGELTTASNFEYTTTPDTFKIFSKETIKDEVKKLTNTIMTGLEDKIESYLQEHTSEISKNKSDYQTTESVQLIETSSEVYLEYDDSSEDTKLSSSEKIYPKEKINNETVTETLKLEFSDSAGGSKGGVLKKSEDITVPKYVHDSKENVITPVSDEKYVSFVTGEVLGRMANVSIKIRIGDSSFYVPSNAHFSVDTGSLLLNITWPSSAKLPENCVSFALTNKSKDYSIKNVQLHLLQGSRMETWNKNISTEDYTSEKGSFSIELEDDVEISVSNLEFLIKSEDEEVLLKELGRSTVNEKGDQLEMGIAIGAVTGILLICVIGYVLVTRSRKRTLHIESANKHDIPA